MKEKKQSENINYIKLIRDFKDKAFYSKDSEKVHLWIHLLLSANWCEKEEILGGKPYKCKAGQFTTGRKQLSQQTGISESKIERILTYFEKVEHQIEQQKTSTNRLISILNWDKYQQAEQCSEQRVNRGSSVIDVKPNTYNTKIEQQIEQQNDVVNIGVSAIYEGIDNQSEQRFEQQVNNDRTTSEQRVNTPKEVNIVLDSDINSSLYIHFEPTEPIKTWKEDYEIYLSELRVVYLQLINDTEWINEKRKYNPNVDIHLTLEKVCKEFWATEAGWQNKKKSRTKTIDWKSTLTNALSIKTNRVYEQSTKSTSNNRKELENLRDLSERVLQEFAFGNDK